MPSVPIPGDTSAPVVGIGPAMQYQVPASTINLPGTIAGSGSFTTPLLPADGFPHIALAAKLTNAGTVLVHRYLDTTGSIEITAASSLALSANTLAITDINDGKVFQSFKADIINGATGTAVPSNFVIVLQSN